MHMLPQLRKLEENHPNELVVIGVHSPKFAAEKSTENVRKAVQRLEIEHPVVSDPHMTTWSAYGVRAWPTLMLVDPAGKVIGKQEGEFRFEEFNQLITNIVDDFAARGAIDRRPLSFGHHPRPTSPLLFPGKVLADATSRRLFVADSGNHRIVVSDLAGKVQQVIGGGQGFRDGGPATAAFDKPQGLALDGETLYVADTWNHAIRKIDLTTGGVTTIAGTGEQAVRVKEGPAADAPLNSPWDLALRGDELYVAMAGTHQIWRLDLPSGELVKHAGSGREALVDGPLPRATFAQPSGICADGDRLYVACSESSAIRELPTAAGGQVSTLVGLGLFDFGDVDGTGDEVLLQHPLAVAVTQTPLPTVEGGEGGPMLLVADSYNNRIKLLDPATRKMAALMGNGKAALNDGEGGQSSFWEPGGLSVAGETLYVADTNNHAIRRVELATLQVTTLDMQWLQAEEEKAA